MADYIGAIDQGTTSTRFIVFDRDGQIVTVDQREHEQITPKAGWVEHDAKEVWRRTREVIGGALANSDARGGRHRRGRHHQPARDDRGVGPRDAASRSTTRSSGRTRAPTRSCASCGDGSTGCATSPACRSRPTSPARRSSGSSTTSTARARRPRTGELAFGTMDTWVALEPDGRPEHVTDVTNASRTLLMDLETLDWHEPSLELMGIPRSMLPEIKSSSEDYGEARGTAIGGTPGRRHPRRPAGRAVRPDLLRRRATPRTPTAPARSCWSTPARSSCAPRSC